LQVYLIYGITYLFSQEQAYLTMLSLVRQLFLSDFHQDLK
jgi:hypothetical protein